MEQKNSFLSSENIKYIYSCDGGDNYIIYKNENNYFATYDFKKIYIISFENNNYFFNKTLGNKFPLLNNFNCQFNLKNPITFLIKIK